MTKKKKHKFKIGDNVTFKFFDGGVYTGVVDKLSYMGEITGTPNYQLPQIRVAVKRNNGKYPFTYYPISEHYVISSNGKANPGSIRTISKANKPVKAKTTPVTKTKPMSELQAAIQKQKDFINHKSK